MFYFVPGIIVSGYIFLARFVYGKEGLKGMDALLRSRDLVLGNWWSLTRRLAVLSLIMFGVLILILVSSSFVTGLIAMFGVSSAVVAQFFGLVSMVFQTIMYMIFVHAGMQLYRAFNQVHLNPVAPTQSPGRWKYVTLACLGLVPVLVMLTVVVAGVFQIYSSVGADTLYINELNTIQMKGEVYYNEEMSYLGFCQEVEADMSNDLFVVCVDSTEGWAMTTVPEGERMRVPLCVDNMSGPESGILIKSEYRCDFTQYIEL